MTWECGVCGKDNAPDVSKCAYCGAGIGAWKCQKCGCGHHPEYTACVDCGCVKQENGMDHIDSNGGAENTTHKNIALASMVAIAICVFVQAVATTQYIWPYTGVFSLAITGALLFAVSKLESGPALLILGALSFLGAQEAWSWPWPVALLLIAPGGIIGVIGNELCLRTTK